MRTRLLAAVIAATFATACLHPQPCTDSIDDLTCPAEKKLDSAGMIAGTALLVGLLSLILEGTADHASFADSSGVHSEAGRLARLPVSRQALLHAAAGRCAKAADAYERLREVNAPKAAEIRRNAKLAACLDAAQSSGTR